MSRREEFKTRMKEFKQYKDTTGKGYWEWKLHSKVSSYALGGDNKEDGEDDDVFAQFIKENPIQPGSVAPKDLVEQNRMQNLPYEQNEYQKQFAKSWYTQRAKYSKYDSQLGNGKLGRILETIDKSTYQTIPEFAETELKEYMRINNIDKPLHPMEIELKSEQLQKKDAMGFARPNAYAWHVKPKTIKTPKRDYRGLGWHEGIGHIVGDNSTEIIGSAPKIWVKNQSGDKEYEKYINKQNEQHASTWEFRGANAEMLDDNGKRYIDPNRQLTPYDIRRMKEKGATIPVEWRNSNITESDIANFLNSFAYQDKPQDTFDFNISNSTNEVFFGKNGGQIPSYEEGGTNEDRHTSIVTNTVKKALERGDIQLVQRILKRGNKEDRKFYYPDNGSIQSVLNIYDTPLLGDALSLLDALKYSIKGDWDNASLSYMDAASPLALFSRSKLNWKGWGAKKKYIPEYEAIEREAKKNSTWLKNADGTDFTGDPREWVVKRSKKFREAFGDKYLEGYTGMRSPYNPRELLDTYLSSRERAYTYTPSKLQVKKKGDTGIAKLVVPDTDTYTVDALGNDWLHLTDKSINPYNFTNTNQIVSSIQTPVINFKNIRDDGPFGMRDIAEDQFVAKSTTPRKSVLYNNGDFDLSNPDIFKTTITPYIGYKLYNKANREETQSYKEGGETEQQSNDQGWLSRLINALVNPMPFIYSNPTQTLSAKSIEADKQRDDIRYNRAVDLSKSIYEAIRASQGDPATLPIEVPLSIEPADPIEPDAFDPGQAFFLTKDDQKRFFENNGYRAIVDINTEDEDIFKRQFGTVRGAAKQYLDNGYQIPIYEYTADSDATVSDSDVVPVGNFYSASGYIKPKKYISTTDIAFLPHSGNHSNTVYLHKNDGKLYIRSWDLNDYGTGSSGSKGAASTYNSVKKRAANSLDLSGNPFIQRTGYVPLLYKEQYDELPEKVKQNIPSTAIQYLKPIPDNLNYKKVVEKAKQKKSKQRNK